MKKIVFDKNINLLDKETIDAGPLNNGFLTSRATFVQETFYQTRAYDNSFSEFDIKSLRYESQHYGRLNKNLLSIAPVDSILETVEDNVNLISFVADAYKAFYINLQLLKQRKNIPKTSVVYNFKAQQGLDALDVLYFSYFENEYQLFLTFVQNNNYDKNIKNFDSFKDVFIEFINKRTPAVPLNKSSFVKSKFISNKINGLSIDLASEDPNDDNIKYNNFIKDIGFKCYLNAAKEYGFFINKDRPWQIIADLNSPYMKFYFMLRMKRYQELGVISENPISCSSVVFEECKEELENFNLQKFLFEKNQILNFFEPINLNDIKHLKRIIGRFYNSYIQFKPNTESINIEKNEKNNFNIIKKDIKRKQINILNLVNENEDLNWIRMYVFTKCRESNMPWDQAKFNAVCKKFDFLYSGLDKTSAMVYLEAEINKVPISKRKNRNFKL